MGYNLIKTRAAMLLRVYPELEPAGIRQYLDFAAQSLALTLSIWTPRDPQSLPLPPPQPIPLRDQRHQLLPQQRFIRQRQHPFSTFPKHV